MAQWLKVVSDGTYQGTRVTTQEGEPIDGVTSLTWTVGPWPERTLALVTMTVECAVVELEGALVAEVTNG